MSEKKAPTEHPDKGLVLTIGILIAVATIAICIAARPAGTSIASAIMTGLLVFSLILLAFVVVMVAGVFIQTYLPGTLARRRQRRVKSKQ